MSGPEVVVVGSLNYDLTIPVPRLPRPGETILGGRTRSDTGGKGANQAVAAARLGRSVAMIGRVGSDDQGRALLSALRDAGVDGAGVVIDDSVATGMAVIAVEPGGENLIMVAPGANAEVAVQDIADVPWRDAAVTLVQLEVPLDAVGAAVQETSGTVILNPAPAMPLPSSLLAAVDVLVPNRTELGLLAGSAPAADYTEASRQAWSIAGPNAVVVTLGAEGALVVENEGARLVPAPEVEALDATAAGDAFCGALADALVRGESLVDAVRWAVAAGAVTVTRPGAQSSLPTTEEVRAMLEPRSPERSP